jgi:hypothetical protein
MRYRFTYYIDKKKFTTKNYNEIPEYEISSPGENTPAYQRSDGIKVWCQKGHILHRLTGPTCILPDGSEYFYLNDKEYKNVQDWLKEHPNQTNAFQIEMLLKYT